MLSLVKSFIKEEDGMGVIEIVIIIAVLIGLALLFQNRIMDFAKKLIDKIFNPDNIQIKPE